MAEYDYVIAGGGSAGCVLAARLTEDPSVTVCLLEAGGDGRDLLVRVPAGAVALVPGRAPGLNGRFETEPQPGLDGRRGYQPRGRGLGGSSAINAMLYVRGHPSDYDDWAAAGCTGWGWADVLPFFLKAEGNQRGPSALHGAGGPLQVGEQPSPRPVSRAFLEACAQSQIRLNDDFNGPEQDGAGLYQVTQFWQGAQRGERCSAAAAYLHPAMERKNLHVMTGARATRILLEEKRATGVRYRRGNHEETATARREVLVAGGAFGSPQLLLLSGIGPADELKRHGIEVRHALPGVGRNLQDHLDFVMLWKSPDTDTVGISAVGTLKILAAMRQWRRDGTGLLTSPAAEAGAFLKSDPALPRADLQLHFLVSLVDDHLRKIRFGHGYSCHVCVLRPYSRGEVGLKDADPLAAPRIDPRFLSDERDAALLAKGARITQAIMGAPALEPHRGRQIYMTGRESDDELMAHIRARADTIYHPVGTCRMGTGEDAVVDPQLRVRGTERLRVVDASVMPTLIGGNTNAPTIMIAEKAAEAIRAAR
ncbi:MAG: glucose-methanol-choline oxidoreductase [Rhizobiales bacterium 68-8]|nr:MAG: glucose-methanol-choline oxidoreductase [Rhizobiales bacterium 68-8]